MKRGEPYNHAKHRETRGKRNPKRNRLRAWLGDGGKLADDGVIPETDFALGVLDPSGDILFDEARPAVEQLDAGITKALELCHMPGPEVLIGGEQIAVDPIGAGGDAGEDNRLASLRRAEGNQIA